jgi:SAM-dependent methyltransferase
MEEALLDGVGQGTRVMDVACGVGSLTAKLAERGALAYGIDPSGEMLGIGVLVDLRRRRVLVRGLAEALPVRRGTFDQIVCEGALDHFVDPSAFMREAAHALAPGGRLIVALANYDSLSCRIGRFLERFRPSATAARPYWQPPNDHNHRGNPSFVRNLQDSELRLEGCTGISLLWLLPGWGPFLDSLPRGLAEALVRTLDRLARPTPQLADVIVGVWRKAA